MCYLLKMSIINSSLSWEKDIINFINLKKFRRDLVQRFLMDSWMLALWKGKKCYKYGALGRADKNQLCVLLTSILFHSNSILWFYDLLRPKLVKGLNPTLTVIKSAKSRKVFSISPHSKQNVRNHYSSTPKVRFFLQCSEQ